MGKGMGRPAGSKNRSTLMREAAESSKLEKQQKRASAFFGFTLPKPKRQASASQASASWAPASEASEASGSEDPDPAALLLGIAAAEPAEPIAVQRFRVSTPSLVPIHHLHLFSKCTNI